MKWQQHRNDMFDDPRIERLRSRFPGIGYEVYFVSRELIGRRIDKQFVSFELVYDAELLAPRLHTTAQKISDIFDSCVELNLFEKDPRTGKLTCLEMALDIDNSIVKNPEMQAIQATVRKLKILGAGTDANDENVIQLDAFRPEKSRAPELSGKGPGSIPDSSGTDKTRLDQKATTPACISAQFSPSDECRELLHEVLIPDWFIEAYLGEFVLFWRGTGLAKLNWDSVFYRQCMEQYVREGGKNRGSKS